MNNNHNHLMRLIKRRTLENGVKLFDVQPAFCRTPISVDLVGLSKGHNPYIRAINFDPTPLYQVINDLDLMNPYSRSHSVSMTHLFSGGDGNCACGCGIKLTGRQTRWGSEECNRFAVCVFNIIAGRQQTLRFLRSLIVGGYFCEACSDTDSEVELDHIHPVKHGGGGGWLSNYQFKCKACHRQKTNKDFGYKSKSA